LSFRNVRADIGWDSREFVAYGTRTVDGKSFVSLIHLNFNNAYSGGQCREGIDYESWTPQNEHGNCFMGQKTQYQRRKFGTPCYYGRDFVRESTSTPCPCTEDDYECTSCFFRPSMGSKCQRECGPQAKPSDQLCPKKISNATYEIDNGYCWFE